MVVFPIDAGTGLIGSTLVFQAIVAVEMIAASAVNVGRAFGFCSE